jgi:hypothetical protein
MDSRERFRNELVSAAEEEAAAIVESARREITTVVRRARRDLLLIRAQLHLCGVEPSEQALIDGGETGADHAAASSLDGTVPRDAVVVSRTHVLRDVVADATTQLAELSDVLPADERTGIAVSGTSPTKATATGVLTVPRVIGAGVLALLVLGGVTVWTYRSRPISTGTPAPETVATTASPTTEAAQPLPESAAAVPPTAIQSESVASARILLQTTRAVWMRVDVDGTGDTGRLYPAGTTKAVNPEREVVIRAGDAGAVLLSVGGAAPAALGSAGQVVTRRVSVGPPPAAIRSAEPSIAPPQAPTASVSPSSSPTPLFTTEPPPSQATAVTVPVSQPLALPPAPAEKSADTIRNAEILARHTQWLDAYARGDRAAARNFTTDGFSLRDERTGRDGRPAAGTITPAQVSDIRIDVAGVGAVLSARVHSAVDGVVNESLLSEIWIRGDQQQWSLMGVRITPVEPPRRDR